MKFKQRPSTLGQKEPFAQCAPHTASVSCPPASKCHESGAMKAMRVRKLCSSFAHCQGSLLERVPSRKPEEHIHGNLSVAGPFVGFFLQEIPLLVRSHLMPKMTESPVPWMFDWVLGLQTIHECCCGFHLSSCLPTMICCALCKMEEVKGEEEGGQGISWLLNMETQTPNFKTSRCWPSLPRKKTKSKSKISECFFQKMGILAIVS